MTNLQGKTIVITGSSRGLGFEIARQVLQSGGNVVISSRSQSAVDAALQQLTPPGQSSDHVAGIAADVADIQQVRTLALAAIATFGSFQVWINNAAISGPYGPFFQVDPATAHALINTNIAGAYHGSLVASQYFLRCGQGKLINILGRGAKSPAPFQSLYSASKAWLRSFTSSLAKEIDNPAIGVFAFNPGMMLTDLLTHVEVIAGSEERLKAFPTVIRLLAHPPSKAAKKAIWIASAATDGKTGKIYSMTSTLSMLAGGVSYLWQKVTRQATTETDLQINTVEPFE